MQTRARTEVSCVRRGREQESVMQGEEEHSHAAPRVRQLWIHARPFEPSIKSHFLEDFVNFW